MALKQKKMSASKKAKPICVYANNASKISQNTLDFLLISPFKKHFKAGSL